MNKTHRKSKINYVKSILEFDDKNINIVNKKLIIEKVVKRYKCSESTALNYITESHYQLMQKFKNKNSKKDEKEKKLKLIDNFFLSSKKVLLPQYVVLTKNNEETVGSYYKKMQQKNFKNEIEYRKITKISAFS